MNREEIAQLKAKTKQAQSVKKQQQRKKTKGNENGKKKFFNAKQRKIEENKKKIIRGNAFYKGIDYTLPLDLQSKRSVICVESMPTGMEEKEILTFFRQFGQITRFRLKRNKYGRCLRKGYIEFTSDKTAPIVVDAINDSMMYKSQMTVRQIDASNVQPWMFRSMTIAHARKHKKLENETIHWNRASTIANLLFKYPQWCDNLVKDDDSIKRTLRSHGIEYNFDGFAKEMVTQENSNIIQYTPQ